MGRKSCVVPCLRKIKAKIKVKEILKKVPKTFMLVHDYNY